MHSGSQRASVLLACLLAVSAVHTHAATPSPHAQAIVDARAGRHDAALQVLEQLARSAPGRVAYRHDWIAVLSWAGRYTQCLEASAKLPLGLQTPGYVLAAIGKAGLADGQPRRAAEAYGLLSRQQPQDADPALGLALAWLDGGEPQRANVQLTRVLRLARHDPAALQAAHAALMVRQASERAAPFATRLQTLGIVVPESPRTAMAPTIVPTIAQVAPVAQDATATSAATASSALPSTPLPSAQATASTPTDAGLASAQEQNALHIRRAEAILDADFGTRRYDEIDAALRDNAALDTRARAAGDTTTLLRLRRDRVVALRNRLSMQEAITAFQALDSGNAPVPAYVVRAAADATLALRQPLQAVALYQRVLQATPDDGAALSGLMYAQLEAEDFPAAENSMRTLQALHGNSLSTRLTEAMLLRFADRLRDAQALVDALASEHPQDARVWLEQAELLASRGLPRAAEERYRAVLAVAPERLHARVGLANARWAQGDIPEVARMVRALLADAPEHPAVQRLARAWQRNRDAPVVSTSVTRGLGQGAVVGNNDLVWDSSLVSGQFESGLRVFANHHLSKATFNSDQASHERVGMGVEWTQRDLQAQAEVGRDLRNGKDAYWAAGVGYQLNDQVSVRARHESQTNDFPVKGRLPDGEAYLGAPTYLHADRTIVGAAYRWNESRRVAADFSNYQFNDGNHRQALSTSWVERLYSGYGRTLDFTGGAYTSTNTLRDALYFNPQRDTALSATLTGDWLTWREYDRSFNQRVAVTLGTYHQQSDLRVNGQWVSHDYGWNPFQELRYEHEWNWGPDLNARYGVGWRRFPYDGVQESKRYVYFHLRYRF